MTQELIVNLEEDVSSRTKLRIAMLEIERLQKENDELKVLVDKSQILHYNDNFQIIKQGKAEDIITYFNEAGDQLPF